MASSDDNVSAVLTKSAPIDKCLASDVVCGRTVFPKIVIKADKTVPHFNFRDVRGVSMLAVSRPGHIAFGPKMVGRSNRGLGYQHYTLAARHWPAILEKLRRVAASLKMRQPIPSTLFCENGKDERLVLTAGDEVGSVELKLLWKPAASKTFMEKIGKSEKVWEGSADDMQNWIHKKNDSFLFDDRSFHYFCGAILSALISAFNEYPERVTVSLQTYLMWKTGTEESCESLTELCHDLLDGVTENVEFLADTIVDVSREKLEQDRHNVDGLRQELVDVLRNGKEGAEFFTFIAIASRLLRVMKDLLHASVLLDDVDLLRTLSLKHTPDMINDIPCLDLDPIADIMLIDLEDKLTDAYMAVARNELERKGKLKEIIQEEEKEDELEEGEIRENNNMNKSATSKKVETSGDGLLETDEATQAI